MMIRTALTLLLAGTTAYAAPQSKDDRQIERRLRGLVPGKPQACINPSPSGGESHSGNIVLMKDRSGILFMSRFEGGCTADSQDALITTRTTGSLCRGEIAEVRDLVAGFTRNSCIYGDFVPYRRP